MDIKIGDFIWGSFPFAEGDGRSKVRPALILAVASTHGHKVYLCVGLYSATEKVRGAIEITISAEEAQQIGLDYHESVLRFSRHNIQALMDSDIVSTVGTVNNLPPLKQVAIHRAAKAIGCGI